MVFSYATLRIDIYHFVHMQFSRSEVIDSEHTQGAGGVVYQSEYKEMGLTGGFLEVAYYIF